VNTEVMRNAGKLFNIYVVAMKKLAARTPEEGGRTLVFGAYGGKETHGMYLDDCAVGMVSPFIESEDGAKAQKKLWKELSAKLEKIEPGVMSCI
jgi:retinol dehydrogenase-12